MLRYKKFLIKTDDHFEETDFPKLQDDMEAIKAGIAVMPEELTKEIIISFVKDRSLIKKWEETNPGLAELLSSKTLPLEYLEGLFDSCSNNKMFRLELETYARKMLD